MVQRYAEWKPTQFDTAGLSLEDRQDWLVAPVIQTRDSGPLEESNFASVLKDLGGEQEDKVEVHRFGHWGPGWFEIILCHPSLEKDVEAWENCLSDYPVADEMDWSQREMEAVQEMWDNASMRERMKWCKEEGLSFLQARKETPPDKVEQSLREYL